VDGPFRPDWVGSDDPASALEQLIPDPQQRRIVLNGLKPFVPRPRGDVERIKLSGRAVPRSAKIQLTRGANGRIDQAIDRIAAEQVEEHEGDLREIDLDKLSFVLRNTENVRKIPCTFEEDLLEMAKEARDRRFQVTGVRRVVEGRRIAPTLCVTPLVILDEDATESTVSESPL